MSVIVHSNGAAAVELDPAAIMRRVKSVVQAEHERGNFAGGVFASGYKVQAVFSVNLEQGSAGHYGHKDLYEITIELQTWPRIGFVNIVRLHSGHMSPAEAVVDAAAARAVASLAATFKAFFDRFWSSY